MIKTSKAIRAGLRPATTARRWDEISPPTPEQLLASQKLFSHEQKWAWEASSLETLPASTIPEIAFLGCSNVGKSSLLNVLMHAKRRQLVRTSSKPGSTQTLKAFTVSKALCLVDTPGYGYRSQDAWGPLIMQYVETRRNLKRSCLLIDASHGFKAHDETLISEFATRGVPFQVVLTKIDKIGTRDVERVLDDTQAYLVKYGKAAAWPEVIGVSQDSGRLGVAELQSSICHVTGLLNRLESGKNKKKKVTKIMKEEIKVRADEIESEKVTRKGPLSMPISADARL